MIQDHILGLANPFPVCNRGIPEAKHARRHPGGDYSNLGNHGNPSYPPQSYPPRNKALLRAY